MIIANIFEEIVVYFVREIWYMMLLRMLFIKEEKEEEKYFKFEEPYIETFD